MRTALILFLIAALTLPLMAEDHGGSVSWEQAIAELRSGNQRFVAGAPHVWAADATRRDELAKGQHPKACVITCSDSRVSPEILFDQSIGDIFVVRLAGNVITSEVIGSVEYAVEHLQVPVVVVLGHSSCGAIGAALKGGTVAGPVGTVISRLLPAIDAAKSKGFTSEELPNAVARENARQGVEELMKGSRAMDEAMSSGRLTAMSAVYDLKSGRVDWTSQVTEPAGPAAVAGKAALEQPVATAKDAVTPIEQPAANHGKVKIGSTSTAKR